MGKLINVVLPSENHLYWPELDIDLAVESVLYPERFPLVSGISEQEEPYTASENEGGLDWESIEDCVLALLRLTLHGGVRAWKGLDFEVLERLCQKGLIFDPRGKGKSVALTPEGLARSERLFTELFKNRKTS